VGGAPGLFTDSKSTNSLSAIVEPERNQAPMNTVIHFIGVDVHKESVSVSIARPTPPRSVTTARSAAHFQRSTFKVHSNAERGTIERGTFEPGMRNMEP
jgi:hypothetical protein